jgi:excisionase family DNA binding protein
MDHSSEAPKRLTVNLWPDVGHMLGVSRGTVYEMARKGELPVIRCGRRLIVPLARLKAMLGETETPSVQAASVRSGNAA